MTGVRKAIDPYGPVRAELRSCFALCAGRPPPLSIIWPDLRRVVFTAVFIAAAQMDGCPRSESNKCPSLDSQSHMRSKRYSSLEFCIWHVLLYSVIIEVYIYVTVLASLNTSYNNNIIVKHFRGLVLGLTYHSRRAIYSCCILPRKPEGLSWCPPRARARFGCHPE